MGNARKEEGERGKQGREEQPTTAKQTGQIKSGSLRKSFFVVSLRRFCPACRFRANLLRTHIERIMRAHRAKDRAEQFLSESRPLERISGI